MKKSYILLALILAIGAASLAIPALSDHLLSSAGSWGLVATTLIILCIMAFIFEFEDTAPGSKEIALVSMLATISAVLRIPFAAIPGIQPCTYLIICSGYVFGPVAGFMVGAVTALVSNFFLGQGPWTPYQMFAWGLAGVSAAYIRHFNPDRKMLALFGILWGYVFGWIMNLWFWTSFVYPLTLTTFAASLLNSIWFDTFHAVGNAAFLWLFGLKTIAILERFKKRFSVEYIGGNQ